MSDINSKINKEKVPWNITDVIFTYILIFILSIFFTGILIYLNFDSNMNLFFVTFQILLSLSTLVVIYLIVTQKYKMPFSKAFGLSRSKIHSFINLGLVVTIIIISVTTLISIIFSEFIGVEQPNPYAEMPKEKFKALTILAIFFAPIVEEFFFRGFMQPAFTKRIGPILGITITSLIFGFSHVQYIENTAAIFSVVSIGLILGITKFKTGSVLPGIFAHFFNNLLAVIYILS